MSQSPSNKSIKDTEGPSDSDNPTTNTKVINKY